MGSVATLLVRALTYALPPFLAAEQGYGHALALALFLGVLDGWFRLHVARTARSLVAETDALVIASGLDSVRTAWSNVLAIEVWHRLNRMDYVAVHYRGTAGNTVATCWAQGQREDLLLFVQECAKLAQAAGPRNTIARANLGDHAVDLALLRRLSLDLALALLVGMLCGITSHAIWLGAAAGLPSTLMAAAPYLHRAELVRSEGVWWQHHKNGELTRLRVIPRSLRLWTRAL